MHVVSDAVIIKTLKKSLTTKKQQQIYLPKPPARELLFIQEMIYNLMISQTHIMCREMISWPGFKGDMSDLFISYLSANY